MIHEDEFAMPSEHMLSELNGVWKQRRDGIFVAGPSTLIGVRPAIFDSDTAASQDLFGDNFLHLVLMYTLPQRRRRGGCKSALDKLVEISNRTGCGLLAYISPVQLHYIPFHIYGACGAVADGMAIDGVVDPEGRLADRSRKLFVNAGFEIGFDFEQLWASEGGQCIPERCVCYRPDSMPIEFRRLIGCFKMNA